jgi:hypothetical protein
MLKLAWANNIVLSSFLTTYPRWIALSLDTPDVSPLMTNNMDVAASEYLMAHMLSAAVLDMSSFIVANEIYAGMVNSLDLVKCRTYPMIPVGRQIVPKRVVHNGSSTVPFSHIPLLAHAHNLSLITDMTVIDFEFDSQTVTDVVFSQADTIAGNRPVSVTLDYEVDGSPVQQVMTLGGSGVQTTLAINAITDKITMTVPISQWMLGSFVILGNGEHIDEQVESVVLMPLVFTNVPNPLSSDLPAISLLPTDCVLTGTHSSPIAAVTPVGSIRCVET